LPTRRAKRQRTLAQTFRHRAQRFFAAVMIAGKIIRPSVNQPASSETFHPKKITKSPKPNRPNTIDGTPAKFKIATRMNRIKRVSRLYSLR
jgi:hypothetical protein